MYWLIETNVKFDITKTTLLYSSKAPYKNPMHVMSKVLSKWELTYTILVGKITQTYGTSQQSNGDILHISVERF